MSNYTLKLSVADQAEIKRFLTNGQYVNVSKFAGSYAADPRAVVWLSWNPLTENTVTWTETYYVYATATKPQNGAKITVATNMKIKLGYRYILDASGFNESAKPDPTLAAGSIVVSNKSGMDFFCGLAQKGKVEGKSDAGLNALNIQALPDKQFASFAPIVKLWVYTGSTANNGAVATAQSSTVLEVEYAYTQDRSIEWNADEQQFVAADAAAAAPFLAHIQKNLPPAEVAV